ncbi:YY1-associated factor 2 [Exaiptasia diaphana]|uniref:RanBP2-type domain-containing protein n=1 Tax=Exaiptasia diaphana TaxID=2652724 RepID=A0A913XAT0_EXADI|nr:YY1-associated factor 2 [Exaiptasia diaphana]KXJ13503.1 YY1-associated factor 2 [Exaiptasia diaphana]
MDEKGDKKSPNRIKNKLVKQISDDSYWDCSVCTYRNTSEAFKCSMCDVRKGTSTRKPRINAQLVAQQVAQQYIPALPVKKTPNKKPFNKKMRPRLHNVDRSSAQHMAVTVGNVTVIITDYKLLKPGHSPSSPEGSSPVSEESFDPGPSNISLEFVGNGTNQEIESS